MHKQSGNIILVLLFWFTGFSIIAQQNNNYYPNFNTVPDLPSKMVYSVFKDSKGFMWFGTENGLYRWDGYDYKVYQNDPNDSSSISGNMISQILTEDEDGNIWIGTQANGMNIYNPNSETFTRFSREPEFQFDFDFNWINTALIDKEGEIWLTADLSGGINNFDISTGTITSYWQSTNDSSSWLNRISLIYEDGIGRLWVGTYKGLYIFDKATKTYLNLSDIINVPDELNNCIISCIFEDQEGTFWIGTNIGLFKLDAFQNNVDLFKHHENDPHSLASSDVKEVYNNPNDGGNSLLILTRIGMNKLDKSSDQVSRFNNHPEDPKYKAFNAMFDWLMDDNGILWAGSAVGAVRCNVNTNPFTEFQLGPFGQQSYYYEAMTFLEDQNENFWVGTDYGGLLKYDKNMNLIKRYNYDPKDSNGISYYMVFSLFEDMYGELWVGTAFHLDVLDQKNNRFLPCSFPADVPYSFIRPNDFHEDQSGIYWIATNIGIYYQRKQEVLNTSFQLHHDFASSYIDIRTIVEDRHGNIWFGSSGSGVYLLSAENHEELTLINITHDPDDNHSLSNNIVWSSFEDKNNALWFGTANGLNRYDPSKEHFYHFNRDNGLDAKFIYYIEGDEKGNLWLSTEKGIIRFSLLSDTTGHSKLLGIADGLPFEENYHFKIYKSNAGKIYVGGRWASGNGFYCFHPDSLKDNDHVPPVVFTELLVHNKTFKPDSNITLLKHLKLKHNQNFFNIKFSALDYVNPSKNEYAHILEGFDEDWIHGNNQRVANYTNVPPGDYIFRVKGSNNDGLWNEEGVSLKITIFPPLWKTWWAYLLYVIFILTILYFIFRYYFKRQQLLHKLALEQVQTEKLEELDRTKSRFYANISHEFRTPLTLILGPIEKLRTQISDGAKKDLDMMQRNAKRLQNLINQLLSLSKLESGKMKLQAGEVNIVSLVKRYSQSFESLAKQRKIEYKFKPSEENVPVFVDKDKIEKILYNLLSNAFKFTGEGGEIKIAVSSWPLAISKIDTKPIANSQEPTAIQDQCAEIKIYDTGKGIPPEKLPFIFDRFYQAEDNDTRDQQGTGIGLALTKELVELHHGNIIVESEMNQGTIFTVFLPMGKEHLKPEEILIGSESHDEPIQQIIELHNQEGIKEEDAETGDAKPLLLIVEDNDDLRFYIRSYLTDDYRIAEAIDGEMGLEKAIQKIPDLAISDVMMPKMDGMEFCKKMKTDERTNHIPVILLTAKASIDDKLEGLETGADDFLTKPFDPQELLIRINNLISQRETLKEKYKSRFIFAESKIEKDLLSADDKFLQKASRFIEQGLSDSNLNVEQFAQHMAMSQSQLYRKLKALTDLSPNEMIRSVRLQRAANLLLHHSGNIAEIAYEVGFSNPSYFSECFQKQFGKLPSEYNH